MRKKIGGYQIIKLIGKKSMVIAEDSMKNKKALKIWESNLKYNLNVQQLETIKKIQHKNILTPSDIFNTTNYAYVVYEYSNAPNLENYINEKGKLEEKEVYVIMKELITGYEFLWNHDLFHGRLKPQNILIDNKSNGMVKITDFPICLKRIQRDDKFYAPEIISNKHLPNIISDVWSMGIIMKFMLEHVKSYSKNCSNLDRKSVV